MEELLLCLQEDVTAHKVFFSFTNGERWAYINCIYAAK